MVVKGRSKKEPDKQKDHDQSGPQILELRLKEGLFRINPEDPAEGSPQGIGQGHDRDQDQRKADNGPGDLMRSEKIKIPGDQLFGAGKHQNNQVINAVNDFF